MKDTVLKEISRILKDGGHLPKELAGQGYKECLTELSILEEGILIRGERFVIPKRLRKKVLQVTHQVHPGR